MDGRARCMDNIFIERLWWSLKYEAVHLHELTDGFHTERFIGDSVTFYYTERPHSSLGGETPVEAYDGAMPMDMMDKAHALPPTPTGSTTARKSDKQVSGGMIRQRDTA